MLCQVENAKEDMLNQLYSSVRLVTCLLFFFFSRIINIRVQLQCNQGGKNEQKFIPISKMGGCKMGIYAIECDL